MSDEAARRPSPGALAVDTGDAGGADHAAPVLLEAWLHCLAAAKPRGPEAAG
jgi:hypothetical protein